MNRGMLIALLITVLLIIAAAAGFAVGTWRAGTQQSEGTAANVEISERKPLYWVAPMDPNFRRDKPGKSPMGMDLTPVYAESDEPDGTVTISPAVENNLGVRTEEARIGPLWRRIEATAYVGFDETLISHISVRTQGWITRLSINAEGERVKKNELLFELYSPELVNAQKEFLQASKRNDSRLISGAEEKLRALGMIRPEIEKLAQTGQVAENIRVVAPQDGVISSLNVREGMYVQPNSTIMSLADLSSVWLQAEVFESQAEWVASGQAAKASLDYLPGHEFNGQVDYVYPVLDPKTRTMRVRLRFDNPQERLKPNMYARVSIYGKLHPDALSIPRSAVIRAKGKNRVVVALGGGKFRVHEIFTGMESGESVEVLAGIEAGDRVVTSAQFLLDSEASLAGGIRRLDASFPQAPQTRAQPVLASGVVEAVDMERQRIRVRHGPIDELAWPAMTMEFEVLQSAELQKVRTGQNIRFTLRQQHAGEYVIEHLSLSEASLNLREQTRGQQAEQGGEQHTGKQEDQQADQQADQDAHHD